MSALARCACGRPLKIFASGCVVAYFCRETPKGCGKIAHMWVARDPQEPQDVVPGWKRLLNEAFGEELDD